MLQQTLPGIARHTFEVERLKHQTQLAALEAIFDQHYMYSDDPAVYHKHNAIAHRIKQHRAAIAHINKMLTQHNATGGN